MKLSCPSCNQPVPAENINIQIGTAVCHSCDSVFPVLDAMQNDTDLSYKEMDGAPTGINVHEGQLTYRMEIKWAKAGKYFTYLLAGLMATVMPLLIIIKAVEANKFEPPLLFLFIFIAIGGWLLFNGIARLVNTTTLEIKAYQLMVTHSPINIFQFKPKTYPVSTIRQLYATRNKTGETNGRKTYDFSVNLMLKNGASIQLLRGFK